MKRLLTYLVAVMSVAACADSTDPSDLASLTAAFQSVPLGLENAQHSFAGATDGTNPEWGPKGGDRGRPGDLKGHDRGPGFGGFMGGGLLGLFFGDGFGLGFGKGRGEPSLIGICTFDAGTGRINCDPVTRGGLTITRSAAYQDVNDVPQTAFDEATTNSINVRVAVTGPRIRRHDSDTSEVDAASDRTVDGLLGTERTVNGTSRGTEDISGSDSRGHYTVARVAGDTIIGVVIPRVSASGKRPYPTAGTIIRSMEVTLARDGEAPVTRSRREVITYDGSATATIVITDGETTKTCTLPLPHGRISCS